MNPLNKKIVVKNNDFKGLLRGGLIFFATFIVSASLFLSFYPTDCFAICKAKGDVAPDFTLNDIYGNVVKLSNYKGKVVLLTFWATWCAKCWEEIDYIQNSLPKREELVVLLINMETKTLSEEHFKKVKTTVERMNIKYPVLLDANLKAYQAYCITSLPSVAVVDKEGVIQFAGPHFYQAYKESINKLVKELTTK